MLDWDESFKIMHGTFNELCELRSDIEAFDLINAGEVTIERKYREVPDNCFMLEMPVEANFCGPMFGHLVILYSYAGNILDTHCGDWVSRIDDQDRGL